MSKVYEAMDSAGNRVALKHLFEHIAGTPEGRDRLRREVQMLRKVHGPYVAEILDVETEDKDAFIVTRLIDGRTLEEDVAVVGIFTEGELVRLAEDLRDAVRSIHSAAVLHRDLKPSNVMMEGERPILIDFGIAQLGDDPRITQIGHVAQTPGYCDPEVIRGAQPSEAADWWALAAVLAFAATGYSPFGDDGALPINNRVMNGLVRLPNLEPEVAFAFRKALAPNSADRITFDKLIAVLENPEIAEDFGYDPTIYGVESDDGDLAAGTGTFAFVGLPGAGHDTSGPAVGGSWGDGFPAVGAHTEVLGGGTEVLGARTEIIGGRTEVLGTSAQAAGATWQPNAVERTSVTARPSIADGQATETIDVSSYSRGASDGGRGSGVAPGENPTDNGRTQILPSGGHEKTQIWPGEAGELRTQVQPDASAGRTQSRPAAHPVSSPQVYGSHPRGYTSQPVSPPPSPVDNSGYPQQVQAPGNPNPWAAPNGRAPYPYDPYSQYGNGGGAYPAWAREPAPQRLLIFLTAAIFVLVAMGWPIVACVLFCVVMLAAAIVGTVSHDLVEKRKERGGPFAREPSWVAFHLPWILTKVLVTQFIGLGIGLGFGILVAVLVALLQPTDPRIPLAAGMTVGVFGSWLMGGRENKARPGARRIAATLAPTIGYRIFWVVVFVAVGAGLAVHNLMDLGMQNWYPINEPGIFIQRW